MCKNGYRQTHCWEKPYDGLASHQGGSRNTWDKLRPDGPLGWYADYKSERLASGHASLGITSA